MLARHIFATTIFAVFSASVNPLARAQDHILYNFTGGSDGKNPQGSLTLSGSLLYGMTYLGGGSGYGTAFSMNVDGSGFSLLHTFTGSASDGQYPWSALSISGTKLYGTTIGGGSGGLGTAFSMNTDGSGFSVLHNFASDTSNGNSPFGSLTLGVSKLYGMTIFGGSQNDGTAYSMNTDGSGFSVLHSFTARSSDGSKPPSSLILVGSKLYGMTQYGGTINNGTIFSMNTDGTGFNVLHNFVGTTDGQYPSGPLTMVGSKLYGLTQQGGSSNHGTAFSMNINGSAFSLLHTFTGGTSDGANPYYGSLTLIGATFYGTTSGGGTSGNGTVFGMNIDGSGFSLLQSFGAQPGDGASPSDGIIASSDGSTLYAMTPNGGSASDGVILSLPAIVPEPGTFALLGLGALLLAARRSRRA